MMESNVLPPETPPIWWPPTVSWPPHWEAKIDRDYEQHSDRDQARSFSERRFVDYLHDERHDTEAGFADARNARETGFGDARHNRETAVEKTENQNANDLRMTREANDGVQAELRAQRQQFAEALWSGYLRHVDDTHTVVLQTIADNLSDARLARSMNYDRQTEKAMNTQLLESVKDAVAVALKEVMATVPARSGLAGPVTEFKPTPTP